MAPNKADPEASIAAPIKPNLRPFLLISMAAGTVPNAVPTTEAATGRVAMVTEGASRAPIIPPKKKVTEAAVKEKACDTDNNHTVRLKDWASI